MKKSIFFCAALFACALGFQSCDKVDNPGSPTEAVIDNGTELADAVKNFAKEGVLEIPANVVELYVSENIDLSEVDIKNEAPLTLTVGKGVQITMGKTLTNVSIVGDAAEPATIIAKAGFSTNQDVVFSNLIFDASNIGSALFTFTAPTEKAKKADGTDSNYGLLKSVDIENITVKGLKNSLVNNAGGNVFFQNFVINNSIVEIVGNNTVFAFGNGYTGNLEVKNSTIWSKEGHKGFFFQAQGRPKDATGSTSWAVKNCTLYQIAVGKKANNNNSGIKGQATTTMILTNSILVDFGSSNGNEINGWLWGQNSASPIRTYENNTYWSAASEGSAVAGWTDSSKVGSDQTGTSLTTDPGFADAANGDFTVSGADQIAKKTGDPRWFVID
jgi:hypothetical protein